MSIIKARKNHIGQMAEIEKASFSDPWSESAFESTISSPAEIILAAEENGTLAGYIIGSCDNYQAYIEKIAVSPHMRRHGTGKALIKAFLDLLPSTAQEIVLDVRESNLAAIALYEKVGFQRLGIRKNFYSSPKENGAVMILRTERKENER